MTQLRDLPKPVAIQLMAKISGLVAEEEEKIYADKK